MANANRPQGPRNAGRQGGTGGTGGSARQGGTGQQRPQNTQNSGKQPPVRANGASAASAAGRPLTKPQARAQVQRRRYERKVPWYRKTSATVIGAVGIVVALVVIFALIAHNNQSSAPKTQTASPQVVQDVTHVSPSVFSTVGTGGLQTTLQATPANTPPLKNASGKPVVFYYGAEWCPYCAAQRWSVIVALSRFGSFSNLHTITSAGTPEVYPLTNTFTFAGSTYTSQYLDFQSVETQTNTIDPATGNYQPLQTPNGDQQKILNTYDAPPYTSQAGGIPFVDFGDQYVTTSAGYIPDVLQGKNWQQIASALSDPTAASTKAIVGNANYLTAAICKITNNQPADVCTAGPIPTIQQQLPKGK